MYASLYAEYPLRLSDAKGILIFRLLFETYPNSKCHKNPSTGNRVTPCGRTDRET